MSPEEPRELRGALKIVSGGAFGAVLGFIVYVILAIASDGSLTLAAAIDNVTTMKIAFVLTGLIAGAWIATGNWALTGTILYMSLVVTVLGFVLYNATVMLPQRFTILNLMLFLAETISLTLVIIYAYYTVDRTSRRSWRRHFTSLARAPNAFPITEFHVPVYNEPPHIVFETIDHLLRTDYPRDRFRIVVADDSTDEESREEIENFCREHGDLVRYRHRENRRGFKAGALNDLLHRTSRDVELIAVVDADYKVEPNFLKETVGYFEENAELGFLQTPQAFSNVGYSEFTRETYWANRFFYDAILPAKNEANSIIFCGTMGIMRRKALEEAGGWGEDVLSEDAETSIRIMNRGWESMYVPKIYGRGLLPQSFSGFKSQQYRWAFGGMQILKKHGILALVSKLTPRQRWDLITSSLHYFSGVVLTVIAGVLLVMGLSEIFGHSLVNFHKGELVIMGFVPFLIMGEGILRVRWALGKALGLNAAQTMRVMRVWFALMFFTSLAGMRALSGSSQAFVRTPKHRSRKVGLLRAWTRAYRLMRFETTMAWWLALAGIGVFLTNLMKWEWLVADGILTVIAAFSLSFWLLWYAYVFACGPYEAVRGSRGPA